MLFAVTNDYPEGTKFERLSYDQAKMLFPASNLHYAPVTVLKSHVGLRPHNVTGILGIPFVILDLDAFNTTIMPFLVNYVLTETYSRTLERKVNQVFIPVKTGIVELSTIKDVVKQLYEKFPSTFYVKYPSALSFLDVPGYGECTLIEDASHSFPDDWVEFLNRMKLIGIKPKWSALRTIREKMEGCWNDKMDIKGQTVTVGDALMGLAHLKLLGINGLKMNDIKDIRIKLLNKFCPIVTMGVFCGDLSYEDDLEADEVIGKSGIVYSKKSNMWVDTRGGWHNPLTHPKVYGVWRCVRFLEQAGQVSMPPIFDAKKDQV
jgi:hypothetical protein